MSLAAHRLDCRGAISVRGRNGHRSEWPAGPWRRPMNKTASIRWTILAFVILATLSLLPDPCTAADTWPSRTVHFIVTLGPGSGVDIGARLFADKLSARWGQPVVVENRPGGDGMVAITSFSWRKARFAGELLHRTSLFLRQTSLRPAGPDSDRAHI